MFIAGWSLIGAGAIDRRVVVLGAISPFLLFVIIALTMEAPLFWLAGGLPAVIWSVGLGVHLAFTGRVTAISQPAASNGFIGEKTER